MREVRRNQLGIRMKDSEKQKVKDLSKLLSHKSMSDFVLSAINFYVEELTRLDCKDLQERRNSNYGMN